MPGLRAWCSPWSPSCGELRVLVRGRAGEVVAAVGVGPSLARFVVAVPGSDKGGVGRRVGNAGCAARVHLAEEHRHDLGAETLNLLEHELERKPAGVDVPQLPLVVAEALLEAEGLLDH